MSPPPARRRHVARVARAAAVTTPADPVECGTPAGPADADTATRDLLAWYDKHRRALPWRALPGATADPYAVWLSEVMLQQTTVQAVKPYFAKFLGQWPTVQALAAAPVEEVMRAWAGLGYYSRARNMHACAQMVARRSGGDFPAVEAELRALPGIGAYTAAAIAAIAFGRRAVVVDGNVERVMARLAAIAAPMPQGKAAVHRQMARLTPEDRAGDFAQAVMDLGATICTPKTPACAICPWNDLCAARALGAPLDFPVRVRKPQNPVRYGTAFYIADAQGRVLVRTREASGLLGGMTELPGTPWHADEPGGSAGPLPSGRVAGTVKHVFTHFTLMLKVLVADALPEQFDTSTDRWVEGDRLDDEALPTLMRRAIALARQPTEPQSSRSPGELWVS